MWMVKIEENNFSYLFYIDLGKITPVYFPGIS